MKRVFKNPIIMFVLGALIFSSISVYAAHKYYASDITYKDTTLDQALDTLYTKAKTYKNLTEATNVEANTLLSGKKAYTSNGTLVNGSIQTYSDAINVTPSNAQQVLQTAGKYISSNITVSSVPSSYKDTSLATVTNANQIFTGLKAYLKDGTLVTGTGTNCLKGSIICSSKCTGSVGIEIADFYPSLIFTRYKLGNDYYYNLYYNLYNLNYYVSFNPNFESSSLYLMSDFYIKNNKLVIHDWGNQFLNTTIDYVACK